MPLIHVTLPNTERLAITVSPDVIRTWPGGLAGLESQFQLVVDLLSSSGIVVERAFHVEGGGHTEYDPRLAIRLEHNMLHVALTFPKEASYDLSPEQFLAHPLIKEFLLGQGINLEDGNIGLAAEHQTQPSIEGRLPSVRFDYGDQQYAIPSRALTAEALQIQEEEWQRLVNLIAADDTAIRIDANNNPITMDLVTTGSTIFLRVNDQQVIPIDTIENALNHPLVIQYLAARPLVAFELDATASVSTAEKAHEAGKPGSPVPVASAAAQSFPTPLTRAPTASRVQERDKASAFFAPPAPNLSAEADGDRQWRDFLVNLLKCVKRNALGEIVGIDSDARRAALNTLLTSRSELRRFPDFIKKNQAGNILVSLSDKGITPSKTVPADAVAATKSYRRDVLAKLQQEFIVQNVRYNTEGALIGRSLYGGMASAEESGDRHKAAVRQLKTKLFETSLKKGKPGYEQVLAEMMSWAPQTHQTLAHSIHDVPYLTNSFLPNTEFLDEIERNHELAPELIAFFKSVLAQPQAQAMKHLLHSPKTLKLAVSNTYQMSLDGRQSVKMDREINWDEVSEPISYVRYQAEKRPLLSCLYPQDYLYRHEFYIGILPLLCRKLGDVEQIRDTLQVATVNIINRMKADARANRWPAQLEGLTGINAYEKWKSLVEINLQGFMKQYPGLDWESLTSILGVSASQILDLNMLIEETWNQHRGELLSMLSEARAPQYDKTLVSGAASNLIRTGTSEVIQTQKHEAIQELISSHISLDTFDGVPLIAHDVRFYTQSDCDHKVAAGSVGSDFTREDLSRHPMFAYNLLHQLIQHYDSNIPISDEVLNSLARLSQDMITGNIMTAPKIAMIKLATGGLRPVICDASTLQTMPRTMRIEEQRDFSELDKVIRLMKEELQPRLPRIESANNWERRMRATAVDFPEGRGMKPIVQPPMFAPANTRPAAQASGGTAGIHYTPTQGSAAAYRPPQPVPVVVYSSENPPPATYGVRQGWW